MRFRLRHLWPRQASQASQARLSSHARPAQYNISDARNHFCELLARVDLGEEIVIARSGVPVARLVPETIVAQTRPGMLRGHFVLADLS
jgi:prevent-host-death family protein